MPSASIPAAIGAAGAIDAGTGVAVAGTEAAAGLASGAAVSGASSLAGWATAASLASTAIGGIGALQQGRAAAASAGYNAQVASNNAALATQNAQFAGAEGEVNAAASGAKTRAAIGATLADQGASGVDINSGSSVDTRASEAELGMLNTQNIRAQAARDAYGFQNQAISYTGQAALDKSQKESDQIGGYLNAGASVLGGLGKASQYETWLQNGSF